MMILLLGFAIIVIYQHAKLKKSNGGMRDRWISYLVTGIVLVYGFFCVFNPTWVSPNNLIRVVFEPLQRWLLQDPPSPDASS